MVGRAAQLTASSTCGLYRPQNYCILGYLEVSCKYRNTSRGLNVSEGQVIYKNLQSIKKEMKIELLPEHCLLVFAGKDFSGI